MIRRNEPCPRRRVTRRRARAPIGLHARLGLVICLVVLFVACLASTGCGRADAASIDQASLAQAVADAERSETILSKVYTVDRIYRSMTGPYETVDVRLDESGPADDVLWITGYRAEMVAADGETAMPQEFMCHSNLDIDVQAHREAMGVRPSFSPRLFTLSQGQLQIDFPTGYGIPIRRSEPLRLTTQVLNLNHEDADVEVRHKVTVSYVRDGAVAGRMRALQPIAAYGLALTEGQDGYFGVEEPDAATQGPGCLVGDTASDHAYHDGLGRVFTGHWQVPPGRQENRTLVTHLMQVPEDTEIHYIAVHLHPFAESLELRDLTTGDTLFRAAASQFEDRIGLAHVEHFESAQGVLVSPGHDYELVSVYENSSGEVQDSMAVMYIYLRDRVAERQLGISPRGKGLGA